MPRVDSNMLYLKVLGFTQGVQRFVLGVWRCRFLFSSCQGTLQSSRSGPEQESQRRCTAIFPDTRQQPLHWTLFHSGFGRGCSLSAELLCTTPLALSSINPGLSSGCVQIRRIGTQASQGELSWLLQVSFTRPGLYLASDKRLCCQRFGMRRLRNYEVPEQRLGAWMHSRLANALAATQLLECMI